MSDEINKDSNNSNVDKNKFEEICYLCRRPESKAGKMMHVPGNITICSDCMQKTFDTMGHVNNPLMDGTSFNPTMMGFGFPPEASNKMKLKKKEEKAEATGKEDKAKQFGTIDINKLPAPHVIKGQLDEFVI